MLWPIPETGIYYIDEINKKLIRLQESFEFTVSRSWGLGGGVLGGQRREIIKYVTQIKGNLHLPSGRLFFIDT